MSTTPALKVLVVDDSNTIRRSAEIFLKQGGHEVLLADDGFDALPEVREAQRLFRDQMDCLGRLADQATRTPIGAETHYLSQEIAAQAQRDRLELRLGMFGMDRGDRFIQLALIAPRHDHLGPARRHRAGALHGAARAAVR